MQTKTYLSEPINKWMIDAEEDREDTTLDLLGNRIRLTASGMAFARKGDDAPEYPWLIVVPYLSHSSDRDGAINTSNTRVVLRKIGCGILDRVNFLFPVLNVSSLDGLRQEGALIRLSKAAHAQNNKQFARLLNTFMSAIHNDVDFRPAFSTVLGFRSVLGAYHNFFNQRPIPLTDGESSMLAASLLLQDKNLSAAQAIVDRYRAMYHLSSTDSLDLIGAPRGAELVEG